MFKARVWFARITVQIWFNPSYYMVTEVMHLAMNVYLDGGKPEAHLGDLT